MRARTALAGETEILRTPLLTGWVAEDWGTQLPSLAMTAPLSSSPDVLSSVGPVSTVRVAALAVMFKSTVVTWAVCVASLFTKSRAN